MLEKYLVKLREKEDLTFEEAEEAMNLLMSGKVAESEFEEYLVLLAEKGESASEIGGSARAMQANARKISPKVEKLVDVVGTGGDGSNTFNISTTAALVVAGAGVSVAKHGNKAVSSRSGAANVLEALGVRIDLPPEKVEKCIEEVGIGFLFAPNFHPAMKHAAPIRAKLKRRTIFNLLGPLSNPAQTQHELIGVYSKELVDVFAEALREMGKTHAIVVHGDGLDEFTTVGENYAKEITGGAIRDFTVNLDELGIAHARKEDLAGGDAAENAAITRAILGGELSAKRDIVLLNAAAALLAAEKAESLAAGLRLAEESIASGAAARKLANLINFTQKA